MNDPVTILLVLTMVMIILLGVVQKAKKSNQAMWENRWWKRISENTTIHPCGICGKILADNSAGSGFFQDYECLTGHYEFHFDCGRFNVRVGDKLIKFFDSDKETTRNGLNEVKLACQEFSTKEIE
jgi:hypothetical protein